MIKYTPGPWISDPSGNGEIGIITTARLEDATVIGGCGCCGSPYTVNDPVESVGNSILIACAPELFECLAALETLFAPLAKDSTQQVWIDKARELKGRLS